MQVRVEVIEKVREKKVKKIEVDSEKKTVKKILKGRLGGWSLLPALGT